MPMENRGGSSFSPVTSCSTNDVVPPDRMASRPLRVGVLHLRQRGDGLGQQPARLGRGQHDDPLLDARAVA